MPRRHIQHASVDDCSTTATDIFDANAVRRRTVIGKLVAKLRT